MSTGTAGRPHHQIRNTFETHNLYSFSDPERKCETD